MSPIEFVIHEKIHAKQLLKPNDTNKRSLLYGSFDNSNYFSRLFKNTKELL
jgi:hypothetical protein